MSRLAAVTGATGFLGRRLVATLAAEGWTVRVLCRRDPVDAAWRGLEPQVVLGDLADLAALKRLCAGADAVIHVAGVIKARTRADYEAANVEGARRLALAAGVAAPGAPVILISSLAAREPQLSDYAGTKRAGETVAAEVLGPRLTVARPPVVYGPGDWETLSLFKAATKSPVLPLLDPAARIAMIHVEDASRQVAWLAGNPSGGVVSLSDERPEGYSWRELMGEAARACGRTPALVRIPAAAARLAGLVGEARRLMGSTPMLSAGKTRELLHTDWSVPQGEGALAAPPPSIGLSEGFRQTVRWYRAAGWLEAE